MSLLRWLTATRSIYGSHIFKSISLTSQNTEQQGPGRQQYCIFFYIILYASVKEEKKNISLLYLFMGPMFFFSFFERGSYAFVFLKLDLLCVYSSTLVK